MLDVRFYVVWMNYSSCRLLFAYHLMSHSLSFCFLCIQLLTKLVARYSLVDPPAQLNTENESDSDSDVDSPSSSSSPPSSPHPPGQSEAARLLLKCSPATTMVWNLAVFTVVFFALFIILAAWRINFTKNVDIQIHR